MKIKHLMEGVEPKLPGAPSGIKVMTPQQFVAKSTQDGGSEQGVAEGGAETSWSDDNEKITLQDILELTKHIKQINLPITDNLKSKLLHWDGNPQEIERINQVTVSNQFPILVMVDEQGQINWILDGNHRVHKAILSQAKTIPAKLIKPSDLSDKAKRIFRIKEQGVMEATKLPAPTRPFGDQELTDYLDRIRKQEKGKTDKYKLPYIHRSSVLGYYDEAGKKYNVDAIKNALAERPKALLKKNEKMKHSDGELEQFFNIGFAALVGVALDENTNELIIVNTCPGAGSCKIDCFAMKGGKIQFQGPWLSDGRILTYLLNEPDQFFNQLKNEIEKEVKKGDKGGYRVSIRWHDAGDFFSPEYVDMAFKLAKELPNVDFYAYTKVADVALGDKPDNFMINWSEGAAASQEKKVKAQDPDLERTKNSRIVPSNLFYDLLVKDEKKNLVKGPEGQWQVIPNKLPELKSRLAKEYGLSVNSILSYDEWDQKIASKMWDKWIVKNNIDLDDMKFTMPPHEFDKKMKELKNKFRIDLNSGIFATPLKYNVIIAPGEPDLTAKDPGVLSTLLLKH